MSENKHAPVETFDCQGCSPYCYGGYHMESDRDGYGDYVKTEDFRKVEKQRDELLAAIGTQAATDILTERQRQITTEGWTPEHDDEHEVGELATAAACYAGNAGGYVWQGGWPGEVWPWAREWWKPSTPRRDLVKAAALIIAEIERIDRATKSHGQPEKSAKTEVPAIVFFPAGSLGEEIEEEGRPA